jgi:SAM-dependent methyltransferase
MAGDPLFDRTADAFARSADDHIERGAYVRGRLFVESVRRAVPAGARVLDYGCGPGRIAWLLAREGYRVEGLDPSPRMVEAARAQPAEGLALSFRVLDDETSALPEAAYGAVVCSSVIEYVPDADALLRRFHAALAPGGALVLSYANRTSLWRRFAERLQPDMPHLALQHNLWSLRDARRALARAGFRVTTRPRFYEAAPFDKRPWLRPLVPLPWVGLLAILTAVRT